MNTLDWGLLAILLLSALYGLRRGLVAEVLILAGWLGSFLLARMAAGTVGQLLPLGESAEGPRWLDGSVLTMLAGWLGFFLLRQVIGGMLSVAGLSGVDRVLGMGFGLVRGALLLTVLTLLAGLTDLPQHTLWQHSAVARPLERLALTARAWLPADIAARVHFAQADDAAPLSGWVSPQVSDMVQPAMPASPPTMANPGRR